jgi:hypothetical protein
MPRSLLPFVLVSIVLLSCAAVSHAQSPRLAPRLVQFEGSGSSPWSNPYSVPFGSPGGIGGGAGGYGSGGGSGSQPRQSSPNPYTDNYNEFQRQQQRDRSAIDPNPPAVSRDFNVWKDGQPTLCTQTRSGDVYCY